MNSLLLYAVYIPRRQRNLRSIKTAVEKRSSMDVKNGPSNVALQRRNTTKEGVVDKGEEKLKRAKRTLDQAKIEAQNTLAPILERMKHSRKIKNAEKVLKRMSHLLEYPYKMRQALNRGDLSEVVAFYHRVQTTAPGNALRITNRVKEAAENVIRDLKRQCYQVLLSTNRDYMTLLRHGKLVLDLDGPAAYMNILRRCFLRQIAHVVTTVVQLKKKFVAEVMDAYKNGQDLNLIRQNAIVRDVGFDGVYEAENALAFRKQSNLNRRAITSSKFSRDEFYQNTDNESMNESFRDEFDIVDDETDDEMLELESLLAGGIAPLELVTCLRFHSFISYHCAQREEVLLTPRKVVEGRILRKQSITARASAPLCARRTWSRLWMSSRRGSPACTGERHDISSSIGLTLLRT